MKLVRFFILSLVLMYSCQTEKKIPSKADLNGFWEQQGEGEIIEFNDSLVVYYNSSTFNCYPYWKEPREEFNADSPTITIIDENTFTNQEGYTLLTYKKLDTVPTLCKALTEAQINSNTYNFETIWNTFNDQYAFFKERNINWDDIKSQYQSKFTEETPPFEFFLLLEQMVLELQDDHSDFVVPDEFEEQWEQLNPEQDSVDYRNLVKDKIVATYVDNVQQYNGGQLVWGDIGESIAYIQLNGMDGLANYQAANANEYWEKADESNDYEQDLIDGTHTIATKIVNEMQSKEACIIDLRFNPGGFDWVGLAFMSHFIEEKYAVFKKKRLFKRTYSDYQVIDIEPSQPAYLKQVYLLTSPFTVSAAETTTIATMRFPNFKRIGSHTVGALSDVLYKRLPNGWIYHLSNEIYETMDGQLFEVSGIPPDYAVDYPRNEDEFLKALYTALQTEDKAIEIAKELLR